jgi:uncharacterized protein YigE (DUF2233 family)
MLRAMDKLAALLGLVLLAVAPAAGAVECATVDHAKLRFTTCRVDARTGLLGLYYRDPRSGTLVRDFAHLAKQLAGSGRKLTFAMNAGMFHPDFKPVGLLVIDGSEISPINRSQGSGNFFLQPNGVFLIDIDGPRVIATDEYRDLAPTFATQSGPMLLHRGQVPAIAAFRSRSRHLRNGVCVPEGATVAFVISEDEVTFREFADYFSSVLKCTEALYLDGSISSLYAPQMKRADARSDLGPMFGVAE